MAMMAAAVIGSAAIGGIIGSISGSKDRKLQRQAMQQAMQVVQSIGLPPDLSKRLVLEEFQNQGIYTPTLEEDIEIAASQVALIEEDTSLREAQLGALSSMKEASRSGFDLATEADIRGTRQDIAEDVQGKLGQIDQQMQSRGLGTSGTSLAMQLQAAQEGSSRASREADRLMAMGAEQAARARDAEMAALGKLRSQDFDIARAKAEAADEFSLKDWAAKNARQQRNIEAMNQGQLMNLQEQQRIADANIQMRNEETRRQNQAKRDYWQDRLSQAAAMTGQYEAQARMAGDESKRKGEMWAGIGSGVSKGLASYYGGQKKKD